MAYNGYYIKVNGCDFTNPKPKEYKLSPRIIQDLDSERSADGPLHRNILQHTQPKIELTFHIMQASEIRTYENA